MVCDTNISVAFKDGLGLYEVENTTLFRLNEKLPIFHVSDYKVKGKEVSFIVKCPLCDENHKYVYRVKDFIKGQIIIGGCEVAGNPIFVMGNQIKVISFISKYNEVNKKSMLCYKGLN